jgi:hypothetical protein
MDCLFKVTLFTPIQNYFWSSDTFHFDFVLEDSKKLPSLMTDLKLEANIVAVMKLHAGYVCMPNLYFLHIFMWPLTYQILSS